MSETLWAQADPTGVTGYALTSENGSYGILFTVAADVSLNAIWFYSPAGASTLPTATSLYSTSSDGMSNTLITHNTSPSWSGAAGSGWVRDDSFPETAISTGIYYVAQYYGAAFNQGYIYTGSAGAWFPASSSHGLITAPEGLPSSAGNNAPYVNGSDAFPSTWWTSVANINWLADVEVSTSSSADSGAITLKKMIVSGSGSVTGAAASYNTGTTAIASSQPQSSHPTLTIPGGVLDKDCMIIGVALFGFTGDTGIAINLVPGVSGNDWTQIGALKQYDNGTLRLYGAVFVRQATADDIGSTLSFNFTGTPGTDEHWWSIPMVSYTGLDASAIDITSDANAIGASTFPTPSGTTSKDGELGVYVGLMGAGSSGNYQSPPPSGTTLRQHSYEEGIVGLIADTNASVGAAGTALGGGVWTETTTGGQYTSFTLGVPPLSNETPISGAIALKKQFLSGVSSAKSYITGAISLKKARLSGFVDSGVQVTFTSTSDGVDTYSTFSAINNTDDAGNQDMRVLVPDSPSESYEHAFLWLLPVEPGQGTTYGDSIGTVKTLDAHNDYNLTCIQPGFPADPWYANNPDDPQTQQERFMLDLVKWANSNLAVTGTEKHYLIGFSKSGVGGQQLILRNPSTFAGIASWDFPVGDMITRFGDDPTVVYGDETNMGVYELSEDNLAAWVAGQDYNTVNRMWIGAGNLYDGDVSSYDATLSGLGIEHTYSSVSADSHNWAPSPGWVAPALAAMLGSPLISVTGAVSLKKMVLSGASAEKAVVTGVISLKKLVLAGAGTEKPAITGAIRLKKFVISGSSHEKTVITGTIQLKKMRIHGSNEIDQHRVSPSFFVFSPL